MCVWSGETATLLPLWAMALYPPTTNRASKVVAVLRPRAQLYDTLAVIHSVHHASQKGFLGLGLGLRFVEHT